MRLAYMIIVRIAGMFAAFGVGVALQACGIARPEVYMLWIMVLWSVWRLLKLIVWFERVMGG